MTTPSTRAFLDELAAKSPAPGGGAAVGVTGAIAAALAEMVVAYSIDRKALAEHRGALQAARGRLQGLRDEFLALADRDAECYRALNELQRLPELDPRRAGIADAAREATQVPIDTATRGVELLRVCEGLVGKSNPYLTSDLRIAAGLAEVVVRTSGENVGANESSLDESLRGWPGPVMSGLQDEAVALLRRVTAGGEPGTGDS